jgi:hypothetical protein
MKTAKVIIEVSGGCADVLDKTEGVEVEIWDYDCDGCADDATETDDDGKRFIRTVFGKGRIKMF